MEQKRKETKEKKAAKKAAALAEKQLRKEKKAAEKAMEKAQNVRDEGEIAYTPVVNESNIEPVDPVGDDKTEEMDKSGMTSPTNGDGAASKRGVKFANQPKSEKASKKSGLLGKFKSSKRIEKMSEDYFSFDSEAVDNIEQRPAFSTGHNSRTSKKTRPREVAVPYSKLRKDRFFDWPPDPTVSRATPLPGPWLAPPPSEADQEVAMNGIPAQELNHLTPVPQAMPKASNGLSHEMENMRRRYVAESELA